MNFFANKKVYGGKYEEVEVYQLSDEEKALVSKVKVVASEFGASACFFMKDGTTIYTPMDKNAKSGVGATLNVDTLEIVRLSKIGEKDIERIRG